MSGGVAAGQAFAGRRPRVRFDLRVPLELFLSARLPDSHFDCLADTPALYPKIVLSGKMRS